MLRVIAKSYFMEQDDDRRRLAYKHLKAEYKQK